MFNRTATSPDSSYIRPTRRGKHTIFIGMAPGVGKTCRMLAEAHLLKQQGIDVVVGLLETHDRKETIAKAAGLSMVPRQAISRGGLTLTEMDTDAILARQPQLVLVDELAHTNIPGSLREYHVTQIVIGENQRSRCKILLQGFLTQQLVRLLKNVDLHIIATEKKAAPSCLCLEE